MIDKHIYDIGHDYSKQQIVVHVDALQQQFYVSCDGELTKQVDIQGLHHQLIDFQSYLVAIKAEARSIEQHRRTLWYISTQ